MSWTQTLEIIDQTVNVPPGEITIMLMAVTDLEKLKQEPVTKPMPVQILALLKSKSGAETEYRLPEFGSVKGRFISEVEEPDWANVDGNTASIHLAPALFTVPPASYFNQGRRDQAMFLASPQGFEMRKRVVGNGIVIANQRGEFLLELVAIGKYELSRIVRLIGSDGQPLTRPLWIGIPLFQKGVGAEENSTVSHYSMTVNANETTDAGILFEAVDQKFTPVSPEAANGIVKLQEVPQEAIVGTVLPPSTEVKYKAERIILPNGESVQRSVPFTATRDQAPVTARNEELLERPTPDAQPSMDDDFRSGPNRKPAASTRELSDVCPSPFSETQKPTKPPRSSNAGCKRLAKTRIRLN